MTVENVQNLESKVKAIIAEQLSIPIENIKNEAKFIDDLGADSLDVVELIMALEEQFDIEISDQDAEKIATVSDAINYIAQQKNIQQVNQYN
jgi:acyl carrier protein